jgi:hypothetical protein
MTGEDSSEACTIACQNCAVYSVFPSGMTSHNKIAQFNRECIGRFRCSQNHDRLLHHLMKRGNASTQSVTACNVANLKYCELFGKCYFSLFILTIILIKANVDRRTK